MLLPFVLLQDIFEMTVQMLLHHTSFGNIYVGQNHSKTCLLQNFVRLDAWHMTRGLFLAADTQNPKGSNSK